MSCPTCDHTMQCVADWVFWCPRCGTVGERSGVMAALQSQAPKLVERCKEFSKTMLSKQNASGFEMWFKAHWHRVGIAESIDRPETQPKEPTDAK